MILINFCYPIAGHEVVAGMYMALLLYLSSCIETIFLGNLAPASL